MKSLDSDQDSGLDEWFTNSVSRLAKGVSADLDSYLVAVGSQTNLPGTNTQCRCHFIARDGNGRPRLRALAKKLAEQAIDYCIPRSRVLEAQRYLELTGSTEQFARLMSEAKSLFTKLVTSGEGGELLLYLLLERILGAPQVLCKMSLKTDSQMHFHGADGVHMLPLPGGRLAIYWCESKLYKAAAGAIKACFESIAPLLEDQGGGASERDLLLVRDNLDTGDSELDEHLIRFFIEDSPGALLREIRGASLIGFSMDDYPHPHDERGIAVRNEVSEAISQWFEAIGDRVKQQKIESFQIEVFCLPMPSVKEFRDALGQELGIR